MKIMVENAGYTSPQSPKIQMRTSVRGGMFSIRFQEKGVYKIGGEDYWGHLTVPQAKRLVKELRDFINNEVVSAARLKHGI